MKNNKLQLDCEILDLDKKAQARSNELFYPNGQTFFSLGCDSVVAFDVDQTLVKWDQNPFTPGPGKLRFITPSNNKIVYLTPHNKHIFYLKSYKHRGIKVIVWSAAGEAWAKEVVKVLGLENNVDIVINKLTAFYDDLPAADILGHHLFFHDTLEDEEWRDCKNYEGLYQVSNFGRVRKINKFGVYELKEQQQISGGYCTVQITRNNKNKTLFVHRLVAEAFLPNFNNLPIVHHKDGIRYNNNLYNLEWVDASQNSKIKFKNTRRYNSGENNNSAKLSEKDVIEIYNELKIKNKTPKELAKQYKTSVQTIYYIKNKKSWKNLTDSLDLMEKV